jgi:spore germination cell wall hydrolase CwlJ-like protein
MKAVETFNRIEAYFDRNHNLFIKFGGLFAALFFFLYVPFAMHFQTMHKLEAEQERNIFLMAQMDDMNSRMEFLELSYDKKQKVMREVECLAKNIYYEAGSEPYNGKLAVAQVTMNRVKSNQFPRTVCGVVYQKTKGICQFSWVCQDGLQPRIGQAWKESLKIAENILINKRSYNVVGGAKYFHATYVDPTWSNTKRMVAQIGNHIFYH